MTRKKIVYLVAAALLLAMAGNFMFGKPGKDAQVTATV